MRKIIVISGVLIAVALVMIYFAHSKSIINVNNSLTNGKPLYDVYVENGNVGFLEIYDIKKDNIKYSDLEVTKLKNEGKTVANISEILGDKVYATVNPLESNLANRVEVFENGKLSKELVFQDKHGPTSIINDREKNKAYVMFGLSTQDINPNGTPIGIIYTKTDEIIDTPFYIKGAIQGYDFDDKYIYMNVVDANMAKYNDVPGSYILRIDRDNLSTEIVTKNGLDVYGRDLKISKNGYIYITSNGYFKDSKYVDEHKLSIYNKDGSLVKNIPLDPWCNNIVIDNNGIAYISHRDKDKRRDELGDRITVFDTNKNQIIGSITGFTGPDSLIIKDNYLFVSNTRGKSISIVDTNSREIIGNIPLNFNPFTISVVKKD
jgi:hypothetical protein